MSFGQKKFDYKLDHSYDLKPVNCDNETTKGNINNDSIPKQSFYEIWKSYPKCIFCIIGNEFCERFSYYGFSTVLIFYLVNVLELSANTASSVFHAFSFFIMFSPIFGSILGDGIIGKYHTIMWVSLFYASGNVTLAIASTFDEGASVHPYLDYLGLFIIALGSGGIKPCVSPFGGDQFDSKQERAISVFFSIFYFVINFGALISGIVSPLFRVHSCLGEDTCYPLAFGFPAVLMIMSCILFAIGTPFYKRYPPQGSVLVQSLKVIMVALRNKIKSTGKYTHWLDYYLDTHYCENDLQCRETGTCQKVVLLTDIRAVLRVIVVFVPLPFYWAVSSLGGDRYVLQASNMNGKYGSFVILPDQMGVVNTILILLFIPLSQVVYNLLSKICKLTQLRKMGAGGFLAVLGIAMCGFLQLKVNTTLPVVPHKNSAFFTLINYASCSISDISANDTSLAVINLNSSQANTQTVDPVDSMNEIFQWTVKGDCLSQGIFMANLSNGQSTYAIVTNNHIGWSYADLQKSTQGEGMFKISVNYFAQNQNVMVENDTVQFVWCTSNVMLTDNDTSTCNSKNADHYAEFSGTVYGGSDFVELLPKKWHLYVKYNDGYYHNSNVTYDQENQGGIFTLTLLNGISQEFTDQVYRIAPDNTISIFWQLPQYVVMSVSEILFSITGLEFSFTQAPSSMKSVMMAIWFLTAAFGQVIVIFANAINLSNVAYLFFLFAALLFVIMIVFVLLAAFYYQYVDDKK